MPVRSLGECLGENVRVLRYPLPLAGSFSNRCQAQQGLDTDIMPFHNLFNVLQMAAPWAAI